MFRDPGRVNAHVIGNHIGGEADATRPSSGAEVVQRVPIAKVIGNIIRVKRISRSHRILLSHALFDFLAGAAALPESDQP